MKTSLRFVLRLICVLLLVGAIVVLVTNQNTAARLHLENRELMRAQELAQELAQQNDGIQKLREENEETQKLRAENKDLPRLRNQVRQLRREAEELDKLRAGNQQLSAAGKTAAGLSGSAAILPGFVPRAALADVGFGTPEAAAQTFFWAMCSGNRQRLREGSLHGEPPSAPDEEQARREMISHFEPFPGFAITAQTNLAPDEVTLEVKTSANGTAVPLKLKRVENEWKREDN